MTDFDICLGTGDIPTPTDTYDDEIRNKPTYTPEEEEGLKSKGYIQDSTGSWFNPNNYIDSYYMDW